MCTKIFDKQPENSIAIKVPDGYLVAELSGAEGEYPGIRVGFWTEKGWLADIALVESEDVSAAADEASDKYVVHLWKFGEECCSNCSDPAFTSADVARTIAEL